MARARAQKRTCGFFEKFYFFTQLWSTIFDQSEEFITFSKNAQVLFFWGYLWFFSKGPKNPLLWTWILGQKWGKVERKICPTRSKNYTKLPIIRVNYVLKSVVKVLLWRLSEISEGPLSKNKKKKVARARAKKDLWFFWKILLFHTTLIEYIRSEWRVHHLFKKRTSTFFLGVLVVFFKRS